MKAIIIDDEQDCHPIIRQLIIDLELDIQVLGSGFSVEDGLQLIEQFKPELIFLDIEMPDGLGFDLLERVESTLFFRVIFVTAHDHYARTAIKFGAIDYLLKPIDREELRSAVKRAKESKEKEISKIQLDILLENFKLLQKKQLPTRIAISTSEGIHYKLVNEIVRLEAKQSYTEFTFVNQKKKLLASVQIGNYEDQFEIYPEYMRVHRSHLVNLNCVKKYVRTDGGYLVMEDESIVSVSRLYRDELLKRMVEL